MRMFMFSAVCLLTLVMGVQTQAQTEPCLNDAVHQAQIETSPAYARNFEAVREAVMNMRANAQRSADSTVTTLPVVVHVIHTGSAIGVAENISDAQIISAIDGMKRFPEGCKHPWRWHRRGHPHPVRIGEAHTQRRTHNGIVRVDGTVLAGYEEGGIRNAPGVAGADEADVKGLTTWYGEDYINIFVVTEINDNDGLDGTQGFAYTGPTFDEKDGIVVLYNAFGLVGELKPGRDMNRTITHEMGHHLSLYHTFGTQHHAPLKPIAKPRATKCVTPLLPVPTTKAAARPFVPVHKWRITWTTRPRNARMPSLRAKQHAARMPRIGSSESVGEPRLDSCCGQRFDGEWREQLGKHDLLADCGSCGDGDQFGH